MASSEVGKTPEKLKYFFVFDEAYRLVQRDIEIHVIRSKVEKDSVSYGIYFYRVERKYGTQARGLSSRRLAEERFGI